MDIQGIPAAAAGHLVSVRNPDRYGDDDDIDRDYM